MVRYSSRGQLRRVVTLLAVVALVAGACSSGGASATPAATTAAASAPASAPASGAPASATVHVAIVNKDMTPDEVKAAVKAEGGLTVGNWTYAATDELVKQFEAYVKTTYDTDIKLTYVGTQAPSD